MLTHSDIWRAIDRLAREHGFSASGLAKKAGLDPTTFNKSKRITREGKLRWPSTESVSKVLKATKASLGEFISYIDGGENIGIYRNMPLIGFAQAQRDSFFNAAGHPASASWDEIPFPALGDPHAYALKISDASLEPVYRDGDIMVVSPLANIRRGDRVLVKTTGGEIMAKQLRRRSARKVDLLSFNSLDGDRTLKVEEVEWISRIVWASQ